jgi:molybdopterin-biosynthesis enzyme MoeA-like protein
VESTTAPRFGLVVVGDEILSGKRADKHLGKVIELLRERGLRLAWAQYCGDDRAALTELYRRTFARTDVVFSCGGIGATPDDHTRQAVAAALGTDCELHPEAGQLIAERCQEMAREGRGSADMSLPENQQRLKMGEFPRGARIIPNPFNRIPGFALHDHWFLPGFPAMAWPMIAQVLDSQYRRYFNLDRMLERAVIVYEMPESALVPLMEEIEQMFPGITAFSLPSIGDGGDGRPARRHVELGVKTRVVGMAAMAALESAFALMQQRLVQLAAEFDSAPGN